MNCNTLDSLSFQLILIPIHYILEAFVFWGQVGGRELIPGGELLHVCVTFLLLRPTLLLVRQLAQLLKEETPTILIKQTQRS